MTIKLQRPGGAGGATRGVEVVGIVPNEECTPHSIVPGPPDPSPIELPGLTTLAAALEELAKTLPLLRDALKRAESRPPADRLALAGIEPAVGMNDWTVILRCSRREVERLRAAGTIPPPDFKVGKAPRWLARTAREFLAQQAAARRGRA
jgi:hypothetical protein